jgi:hypothetical protein
LVGSHFVEFLARRYGEEKLWRLVAERGDTFFFPFSVSLDFHSVYRKSLGGLLSEFSTATAASFPVRIRPSDQRVVRDAGEDARYAVAVDGTEALISASPDEPVRLTLHASDGRLLRRRVLTDVLPPRTLAAPKVSLVSGLSFSGDARWLYFVAADPGLVQLEARLLRYEVATDTLSVIEPDLEGSGGSVSPDGTRYYFSHSEGDRTSLAVLNLTTGARTPLVQAAPGTHYLGPRVSPDGRHLAVTRVDTGGSRIDVLSALDGNLEVRLGAGRLVSDPSFLDPGHVLFLGSEAGHYQVYVADVATAQAVRITDAPYLPLNPRVHGETVRFLNREGQRWSVDEVPISGRAAVEPWGTRGGENTLPPSQALPSPAQSPLPESAIATDEPYSGIDRLFIPQVRAFGLLAPAGAVGLYGLALSGRDALQFHNWTLGGYLDGRSRKPSVFAGYLNRQLAPIVFRAAASQLRWDALEDAQFTVGSVAVDGRVVVPRRVRQAAVGAGVSLRNTSVELGVNAIEDRRGDEETEFATETGPATLTRRLTGPYLNLRYRGVETTPYAGVRRGVVVSGSATHYPESLGTLSTFSDLRGSLTAITPLPASRRHTLSLGLRARSLVGAPTGTGLLEVGGARGLSPIFQTSDRPDAPEFEARGLPPQLSLFETLRGFEDYSLALERVGIADVTYRYPLILDHGASSLLWIFPSAFLRELDFELFASAAADSSDRSRRHASAGGSLSLSLRFFAPFALRYQVARRLSDDRAVVHSLWLAAGSSD